MDNPTTSTDNPTLQDSGINVPPFQSDTPEEARGLKTYILVGLIVVMLAGLGIAIYLIASKQVFESKQPVTPQPPAETQLEPTLPVSSEEFFSDEGSPSAEAEGIPSPAEPTLAEPSPTPTQVLLAQGGTEPTATPTEEPTLTPEPTEIVVGQPTEATASENLTPTTSELPGVGSYTGLIFIILVGLVFVAIVLVF